MALPADEGIDAERNFDQILSLMSPGGAGPDEIFAATLARPRWQERAACRGSLEATFFPSRGVSGATPAMALCAVCTVRRDCLEFALADSSLVGIWGGTTEKERSRIRRVPA